MTRIHCVDCGEELWGAGDSHGQCQRCQQREHDLYGLDEDDEDEDVSESTSDTRGK